MTNKINDNVLTNMYYIVDQIKNKMTNKIKDNVLTNMYYIVDQLK